MSQPTPPRGPSTSDPLEEVLRAAGRAMEYPPTPPLAGAVRARLERDAARRAGRWDWLPWRRARLRQAMPVQREGGRPGGAPAPRGSGLRWAIPGVAAALAAMAVVVWVGPRLGALFEPTAAYLQAPESASAPGGTAGEIARQAPAAAPAAPPASAPAAPAAPPVPAPARAAAPAPTAPAAPPPAAAARAAPAGPTEQTGAAAARAGEAPASAVADAAGAGTAPAPLEVAAARAGFTPLVPAALGPPDAVETRESAAGAEVVLRYGARPGFAAPAGTPLAVLTQRPVAVAAARPPGGEAVAWAGASGHWLPDPRGAGGALEWEQAGLQLRLETGLSREDAVAIAASVAPVSP